MTTTTRNEAAERLRPTNAANRLLEDLGLDSTDQERWEVAYAALEQFGILSEMGVRRATVERIRARLMDSDAGHESGWVWPILDEEAAR